MFPYQSEVVCQYRIVDSRRAIWVIEDSTNGELVAFSIAGPCELPYPNVCCGEDGELFVDIFEFSSR
jgi:hypothetical protein